MIYNSPVWPEHLKLASPDLGFSEYCRTSDKSTPKPYYQFACWLTGSKLKIDFYIVTKHRSDDATRLSSDAVAGHSCTCSLFVPPLVMPLFVPLLVPPLVAMRPVLMPFLVPLLALLVPLLMPLVTPVLVALLVTLVTFLVAFLVMLHALARI